MKARKAAAPKAAKRPAGKIHPDLADKIRLELVGAHASAFTVMRTLQGSPITEPMATCLLQNVVGPLERMLEIVP